MRHSHPVPIPFERRTCVVLVEPDPDDPTQVAVIDIHRNRATMSREAFEATCYLAPNAVVFGIRVVGR